MENNLTNKEWLELTEGGDLSHVPLLLQNTDAMNARTLADIRDAVFLGVCMRLRLENLPAQPNTERIEHLAKVRDELRAFKATRLVCENGQTIEIPVPKRT